jgi:hypothetical protein
MRRESGSIEFDVAKRTTKRLLAVTLILTLGLLGLHAAIDWHARGDDALRCQICQIAHATAPQSAVQIVAQTLFPITRFTPAEDYSPYTEGSHTLSIPRAPPA